MTIVRTLCLALPLAFALAPAPPGKRAVRLEPAYAPVQAQAAFGRTFPLGASPSRGR